MRDALVVWPDERAPYNLIMVILCVECGAEECGANFHAVSKMLAVHRIRSDPSHLEKHVRMTEHARDSISWRQNFLTVATLIGSDIISLGKTVAATQFPGDCDTGTTMNCTRTYM